MEIEALLGESSPEFGAIMSAVLPGDRVAASLSAGRDSKSPSMVHKALPGDPNEDALLVAEAGDRVLMVVADAHHGAMASHLFVRRLKDRIEDVPCSPMDLARLVRTGAETGDGHPAAGATTLLAVVLRRDMEEGFGFCMGDSRAVVVGGGADGEPVTHENRDYVVPWDPRSLHGLDTRYFEFPARSGALVLAFTDGVHECRYRTPEQSIGARHLVAMFDEVGPQPRLFTERLTALALAGVDGHPGGEDNIAVCAARV